MLEETKLQPKSKRQIYIVIGVIIVALILIVSATVWYFYLRPITFKEFYDRLTANKYKVGDVVKIRDKVDFVSIYKLPEMTLPTNWTQLPLNITLKPDGKIITYTSVGFESTSWGGGDLQFTGDRRNDFQVGLEVEFSLTIKECHYAGSTRLGYEEMDNAALVVYYGIYQVWSGDYNVILDANVSENGTVCRLTVSDVKNPILGFDVENFSINDMQLRFGNNSTREVYVDIPLDVNSHTINDYTIQFFDADANGILSKEDYFIISICELNASYYLRLTMNGSIVTEKSWISKPWQSTSGHSPNLYFRIDTEKNNFVRGEDVRITLTLVNEYSQNKTLIGSCEPAWIIEVINSENQTIDYTPKAVLMIITFIEINASSELFITNWTWKQTKYDPMYGIDSTIDEGGEYKLYALWGDISAYNISVYGWKTIWID